MSLLPADFWETFDARLDAKLDAKMDAKLDARDAKFEKRFKAIDKTMKQILGWTQVRMTALKLK